MIFWLKQEDELYLRHNLHPQMKFPTPGVKQLQTKGLFIDDTYWHIFPNRVAWDYTGTLRPKISPLYQAIHHFSGKGILSGAGDGTRTRDIFLGKEAFYC